MPKKVESIKMLKDYFTGVIKRADHHAPNIAKVIYTLLGLIIFKKDDNNEIEVRSNEDSTGNILWVKINDIRYAFRYEHSDRTIEIRKNSYKGDLITKIDNNTSINDLLEIFDKL